MTTPSKPVVFHAYSVTIPHLTLCGLSWPGTVGTPLHPFRLARSNNAPLACPGCLKRSIEIAGALSDLPPTEDA